jgi:peptidoglycan/xylan/chitin deacetylase (PgdA/CDA1 family)
MKLISFSFDDGGASDIEVVRIFDRLKCRATFNLVSGCLLRSCYGLTHTGIVELYQHQEVGCHTRNHTSLINRVTNDGAVISSHAAIEITVSREELRAYFCNTQNVDLFAYPYGDYDPDLFPILQGAGFRYGRSCDRKDQHAVANPKNRWAMPVTAMLGKNLPKSPDDFPHADGAIHLVGHSIDIVQQGQQKSLEGLVNGCLVRGWMVVPNSVLYSATMPMEGGK